MTHVFKKSLLMAAMVAAFAVAQAGNAMAQSTITVEDAAGIPAAAAGTAQAFYDPATGDVFLSIGDGLSILGVQGTDFNLANNQSIPGFPPAREGELAFIGFPISHVRIPTGVFNLGNILSADPTITDVASFQANAAFGGAEVQFASDLAQGPEGFGVVIFGGGEVVPEPSSVSLLGLAGLAAIARRRR